MSSAGWKDWLVHSDVHILVVAACWMLGGSALIGYSLPWAFLVVGSIGAFLVYRLDHLLVASPEDDLNAPQRVVFTRRNRTPLAVIASILGAVGAVVVFVGDVHWWEIAFLVGMGGILYPLRILPGGLRPKDVPFFKSALIVASWVGGGVVLPAWLFYDGSAAGFEEVAVLIIGFKVVFVLPNLIAVDWLDRSGDRLEQVGSIVKGWSESAARHVVIAMWITGCALLAILLTLGLDPVLGGIEAVGLTGLTMASLATIKEQKTESSTRSDLRADGAVMLDLWVAFPVISWLWWFLT